MGLKKPGSATEVPCLSETDCRDLRDLKEPEIPEDGVGELHTGEHVLGKRVFSRLRMSVAESIKKTAGDSRPPVELMYDERGIWACLSEATFWNRESMFSTCCLTVGRAIEK